MKNLTIKEKSKEEALAEFLGIDTNAQSTWVECEYECKEERYLVMTDDEARKAATRNIANDLWILAPEFLARYMPEGIGEREVKAILSAGNRNANDALHALVNAGRGFDALAHDAIEAHGRGHFISSHDGIEKKSDCGKFYFYKQ